MNIQINIEVIQKDKKCDNNVPVGVLLTLFV